MEAFVDLLVDDFADPTVLCWIDCGKESLDFGPVRAAAFYREELVLFARAFGLRRFAPGGLSDGKDHQDGAAEPDVSKAVSIGHDGPPETKGELSVVKKVWRSVPAEYRTTLFVSNALALDPISSDGSVAAPRVGRSFLVEPAFHIAEVMPIPKIHCFVRQRMISRGRLLWHEPHNLEITKFPASSDDTDSAADYEPEEGSM